MKKYFWICLIISIFFNVYINNNRNTNNPSDIWIWANLLYWLNIIPLLLFFQYGFKKNIYPFVGILGILNLLSYSLPPFFINVESYQLGTLTSETLKWAFIGYLVFYSVFYLFENKIFNVIVFDPFRTNIITPRIKHCGLFFLLFYIISKFLPSITALHHLGSIGLFIYIGTYLIFFNSKLKLSSFELILFFLIFFYELVSRTLDGLLALSGMFILYVLIINSFSKRNKGNLINTLLIAFFLIAYIVINPIKDKFREQVWFSGRYFSITERFMVIQDLYFEYLKDNKSETIALTTKSDEKHFLWRYSYQASALEKVMSFTPSKVPYWNGESYEIFSKLIPRFLWPDKPTEDMGQKFGHTYFILHYSNKNTSMNTPILAEMYMNFGKVGIIIGMIILGLIYIFLNNYFNSNKISTMGKVYSIAIIFPFISHESNFSLVFGNVPLMVLAIYWSVKYFINSETN